MNKRRNKKSIQGNQQNQLRIIGGKWRGRKLSFPDAEGLRPTGDRIRETLFNWLAADIPGARVLDLFAGSAILGIEAASRGAAQVDLVEKSPRVAATIGNNLTTLGADNIKLLNSAAETFLSTPPASSYDIIFLDPPFQQDLLPTTIGRLSDNNWLSANACIYIETDLNSTATPIPEHWTLHRDKQAGQVSYQLYRLC